jgi:hypothetical protein
MSEWLERLRGTLEPILAKHDPRPDISAYREMPVCIFRYPPAAEFALRQELALLKTRLEQQHGKRIIAISLMGCLKAALAAHAPVERLVEAERDLGHKTVSQTIHQVLCEYAPLEQIVLDQVPHDADPYRDVIWFTRAGALYPVYRTSTLLEHLQGKLAAPGVLFFPGELEGPAGLRFMGIHEPEHNYRARIY